MSNSIRVTSNVYLPGGKKIRNLTGLSSDVANLPTNLATGSTFFAVDTKKVYMYEETTSTWYEL